MTAKLLLWRFIPSTSSSLKVSEKSSYQKGHVTAKDESRAVKLCRHVHFFHPNVLSPTQMYAPRRECLFSWDCEAVSVSSLDKTKKINRLLQAG